MSPEELSPNPIVSVIMPFLDTPVEFMDEAVGSVMAQGSPQWELLLIDDGSGATATDAARRLAALDPLRIRCLEHEAHANRGISASRNLGLVHARGKYVAFLDADDTWFPSKLEEQIELMEHHPSIGLLYGNTTYWHSWGGSRKEKLRDIVPRLGVRPGIVEDPLALLAGYVSGDAAVPCMCSVIMRREVVQRIGGWVDSFRGVYEDQVLYARACVDGAVCVSERCWDRYRQWDDSSCAKADRMGEVREARHAFLLWLSTYLEEHKIQHRELNLALSTELADSDPSSGFAVDKVARYLRRRFRKLRGRVLDVTQ